MCIKNNMPCYILLELMGVTGIEIRLLETEKLYVKIGASDYLIPCVGQDCKSIVVQMTVNLYIKMTKQ